MKNRIGDSKIRQRIPEGCKLPERFDEFLQAEPPFDVEWNSLKAYDLRRSAEKEVLPFLHLPDGGLLAFWYHSTSPAVVYFSGHGELRVIARDFDNFLRGLNTRSTGLPDFDEIDCAFSIPCVNGQPDNEGLPVLQEKFIDWFQQNTSLLIPTTGPEAEALRQRVFQIAKDMIGNGLSKVYTSSSNWWSMDYRIVRTDTGLAVTYLDYGEWYQVPEQYGLIREIRELLAMVKHKKRNQYQLSVASVGIISIDRDRELVLVPPKDN